jgi:hypothetical protein
MGVGWRQKGATMVTKYRFDSLLLIYQCKWYSKTALACKKGVKASII